MRLAPRGILSDTSPREPDACQSGTRRTERQDVAPKRADADTEADTYLRLTTGSQEPCQTPSAMLPLRVTAPLGRGAKRPERPAKAAESTRAVGSTAGFSAIVPLNWHPLSEVVLDVMVEVYRYGR